MKKKHLNYCCEDFQGSQSILNRGVPAILISKIKNKNHFYLALERDKKTISEIKKLEIVYCLYCGTKLSKYYKSKDYVNDKSE